MEQFKVACLRYEICGAEETFYSAEEYEIYGDDYICAECFDLEEMNFFELIGWRDIDADLMHSRMADAEMGDL